MMRYKRLLTFSGLALFLILSPLATAYVNSAVQPDQTKLTIYTYESLLADPGFAFDRAFEEHAGLENGSVEVVKLNDAGTIVTKAASEKGDPVADVLIGIDNVLVHQAREQNILEAYKAAGTDNLIDGLVEGLAEDYLLTPYDYGVISLWYLNNALQGDIDPSSFDLEKLLDEDFREQLIVENPQLSSPGLGFLLSTIAMYGDDAGVSGLIDGNWEDFWRQLSVDTHLTSSWGDAISLLYTEEANRSMMVSYTTSPAYGSCLYDDTSSTAVLPSVNGEQYGWQQIEGLGLVKDAPNADLAKQFIDWFIDEEVQSEIHQNQWVYPAHKDIEAPDCYDVAIDPDSITPLNDRIDHDILADNLDSWLSTWEVAWAEGPTESQLNGLTLPFFSILSLIVLVPIIRARKD